MLETNKKKQKKGRSSQSQSKVVALNTLPWNEVVFPERFDDAEGFFGLEEISDVEIVRDKKLGKVEYRVTENEAHEPPEKTPNDQVVQNDKNLKMNPESDQEEQEWEGIEEAEDSKDEDEEDARFHKATKALRQKESRDEAKQRRRLERAMKRKTEKSIKKSERDGTSNENPFTALETDEKEGGDVTAWKELDLSSETLSALSRLNFTHPTPIQIATIPRILNGHDVIGKASTGSGKTLAFGIPIYEYILKARHTGLHNGSSDEKQSLCSPTALIISPTRELAVQLSSHFADLCSSDVSIATITGGFSVHKQQRQLAYADIIIGTPGRLWEVMNGDNEMIQKLFKAQFLILDEADRLLSEGHFVEVEEILNVLGRKADANDDTESPQADNPRDHRQTLVFSATFQKDLQQKLAGKSKTFSMETPTNTQSMEHLLRKINFREAHPQFVDVNPASQMASNLREGIVECAGSEKDLYLYTTLLLHPNPRTLVFTNSITSVRRLLPLLQNLNLTIYGLHSQMPQKARLRSIERFSSPTFSPTTSVLIATDVAARGLDISAVDLIIHYHVPRTADMYVHRSGRTARANRSGDSLLLCAPEEVQGVRRLVAKVHARHHHALTSTDTTAENNYSKNFFIRTLDLDRRVIARLKPRVALSKKIADAGLAKEKKGHEDNWLKTAAEDLGVEYDSDEFAAAAAAGAGAGGGKKKGRGSGRMKRERESRALSKAELGALRAELREELAKRVNVGVSERYLTAGGVDVDQLLSGRKGHFLGETGMVMG